METKLNHTLALYLEGADRKSCCTIGVSPEGFGELGGPWGSSEIQYHFRGKSYLLKELSGLHNHEVALIF